jgi:hypothetical protein
VAIAPVDPNGPVDPVKLDKPGTPCDPVAPVGPNVGQMLPMRMVSLQSHILYVSRVTPLSRMLVTLKAKSVIQHSVARFAVRLVRSTLKRSPERVEIELVGSDGILRTSKAMVKPLVWY